MFRVLLYSQRLQIAQLEVPIPLLSPVVDWSLARTEFTDIIAEYLEGDDVPEDFPRDVDFDAILVGESDSSKELLGKAQKYAKRLSADLASAPQGHVFLNGKHFNLDDVCFYVRDVYIWEAYYSPC